MSNETLSEPRAACAEAQLKQRLGAQVWDLHVSIDENGAVLQGYALNYYAKQMAQHVAMKCLGLTIRANEINVRPIALNQESIREPSE